MYLPILLLASADDADYYLPIASTIIIIALKNYTLSSTYIWYVCRYCSPILARYVVPLSAYYVSVVHTRHVSVCNIVTGFRSEIGHETEYFDFCNSSILNVVSKYITHAT